MSIIGLFPEFWDLDVSFVLIVPSKQSRISIGPPVKRLYHLREQCKNMMMPHQSPLV